MTDEPQLSEDEIRQLQAELDRMSVDDVLIQTVVTLLNVGARKGGLAGGDAPPDLEQTRLAIEGARALIPLLEDRHGAQLGPVKDMVAQLQMAYAQKSGGGEAPAQPAGGEPGGPAASPEPGAQGGGGQGGAGGGQGGAGGGQGGRGPAQQSGRLWVPGQ
jgi:hypothetical protein